MSDSLRPTGRVVRRPAGAPSRRPAGDPVELLAAAVSLVHAGKKDEARPLLESLHDRLPPGPERQRAAEHLDAIVLQSGCGCALRVRLDAIRAAAPAAGNPDLDAQRAWQELLTELGDTLADRFAAAKVRWDDLHWAGSFDERAFTLVAGGTPGSAADRQRAAAIAAALVEEHGVRGLLTIEI